MNTMKAPPKGAAKRGVAVVIAIGRPKGMAKGAPPMAKGKGGGKGGGVPIAPPSGPPAGPMRPVPPLAGGPLAAMLAQRRSGRPMAPPMTGRGFLQPPPRPMPAPAGPPSGPPMGVGGGRKPREGSRAEEAKESKAEERQERREQLPGRGGAGRGGGYPPKAAKPASTRDPNDGAGKPMPSAYGKGGGLAKRLAGLRGAKGRDAHGDYDDHDGDQDYGAGGGNFIKGAIKHPGALRAELHAKPGKPIPAAKLEKAAQAGGTLGRRARFAETLRSFRK